MIVCAQDPVLEIEARIAQKLGPKKYNVWFKNATQFHVAGNVLRVCAPNNFVGEWIERHFANDIIEAAREVTGIEFSLCFSTDPNLAKTQGKRQPDEQVKFVANQPVRPTRDLRRGAAGPRDNRRTMWWNGLGGIGIVRSSSNKLPGGLADSPPCPFCEGTETELHSLFGSHASVTTYWCRSCRSPFEQLKWGPKPASRGARGKRRGSA